MLVLKRCIYECPCSSSLGKENSVFGTIKASVKLFEYAPKRIVVLMVLFKTFHDVDVRDASTCRHSGRLHCRALSTSFMNVTPILNGLQKIATIINYES